MKNKQLTIGAMFLAIEGAFLLIDSQTNYFFADLSCVIVSSMSTFYLALYGAKNGLKIEIGFLILALLLGNYTSYIYVPLGILTSLAFYYFLENTNSRRSLDFMIIVNCTLEILVCSVVYPMIGIPVIAQIKGSIEIISSLNQTLAIPLAAMGLVVTTFLIGIVRAYCEYFVINTLFKRFRGHNYELQR